MEEVVEEVVEEGSWGMKVVVCLKQVPETTEIEIDRTTGELKTDGIRGIINPYDTYALEEAIRIKEGEGAHVVALSVGDQASTEALKEALALGADEAVLVDAGEAEPQDGPGIAFLLAKAVERIGDVDLVLCGKEAVDGWGGVVGPALAAYLQYPQVTMVRGFRSLAADHCTVERLFEDGFQVVRCGLPAVVSVVKEINEPRMASLRGMMQARRREIPVLSVSDLVGETADLSSIKILTRRKPEVATGGEILDGTPAEQVATLVNRLRADKVL